MKALALIISALLLFGCCGLAPQNLGKTAGTQSSPENQASSQADAGKSVPTEKPALNETPAPPVQKTASLFTGKITKDFLKEVIPGQNSESNERVNIIFDCRNMDKEEFDACKNYLPRFFTDPAKNANGLSFGVFQVEPYKSSRQKFNVWYIDRDLMDPALAFNNPNQACDITDKTFTYDESLHNVILAYVCKGDPSAFSTTFPIKGLSEGTLNQKERDMNVSVLNLGPGNVKSIISLGINGPEMQIMINEPDTLGLTDTFLHETGHAIGGLNDEYSNEVVDKLAVESTGDNDSQNPAPAGLDLSGGFPSCALTREIADAWWKNTGLAPNDTLYVGGCFNRYYLIPYKYTLMDKRFDKPGMTNDDLFSPVHRYWICRNIYNMTGSSSGVCLDYQNRYGFDRLLYSEEEKTVDGK